MSRRTPKAIGTDWETTALRRCLTKVWPRMERTGSKVRYGSLPDFDDPERRCPFAWEAKAGEQQRFEKWWAQAKASAAKVGLLPALIWRRRGKPATRTEPAFPSQPGNPWIVFDWETFEPVARFIDANLDDFREHLNQLHRKESP